jgi:hypothetical protein
MSEIVDTPRPGCREADAADLLAPEQIAAWVAPVVDRLRLAVHHSMQGAVAATARDRGLDAPMAMVIGNLRNLAPGQAVARSAIEAVYVYAETSTIGQGIDGVIRLGLVGETVDGAVRLSERGQSLVGEIQRLGATAADALWSGHEERVSALAGLAARAVLAGAVDGGETFRLLAPSQEQAEASGAALLSEWLTGLRFHRFDAHVAAWRSAGLTCDQIKALRSGPQRVAIEADTNRRAATPYATLAASERLEFLAGLAALPG